MRSVPTTGARGWLLLILLALAPMWLIGAFDRGAWTPEEPREADIAWRMHVVRDWFAAQGGRARVLVLLPGHASGELTPLLERAHLAHPAGDGLAGQLQAAGIASIARRYQLPHGRRYALLRPPPSVLPAN